MRWLALLLAAAGPTGAVLAQEDGAAGPFGDERQFFFRCEAELADGPLSASGSMVVDSNGAHAESLVWLSNEPLAFNDYEQESPANLHAFWSEPLGPQAFEAGRLHLMWDAPRRLPRPLLLTVDERLNDGTFAVLMNRYEKRKAAASIRLGHLLRWAGANIWAPPFCRRRSSPGCAASSKACLPGSMPRLPISRTSAQGTNIATT